ncbi:NAD(P)H-binding protein [Nocardiopsis sp. N85]|uniref:SDR family oxidoreductase n=1 Tax=Nocardiopsis sp. N85 TaxID=3029400 RepID=UPI00237F16C1|nr:NAD(P)H-binding protein [Nocardiopsis sp. N85]MDE3723380.1 NAD(P)H-binding protein [Nocardiopsis sp. N85]
MGRPVLVTGATGNTGRHVVAGLLTEGVPVRALVRREDHGLPDGVDVVIGDVTDPGSVADAARGARAAYLVWPRLTADGAGPVVEALGRHVDRIVHLSADGADADDPEDRGVWGAVEDAVRESGAEGTFLRVTGLATNTLIWRDRVRTGVVRAVHGEARRSLVHERDVAAVAVRALVDDGHAGRAHLMTGPASVSQTDQVRILGEAIGVDARWEEQPEEEAREELTAVFGDPGFAHAAVAHWAEMIERPEAVSRDVERVLGRPALTFEEWARDHADDFR